MTNVLSLGPEGFDEPDGRVPDLPEPEVSEDDGLSCTYLILSSQEKLNVNVTPQAISVLRDVLEVILYILFLLKGYCYVRES